jgi:hypothetical protein
VSVAEGAADFGGEGEAAEVARLGGGGAEAVEIVNGWARRFLRCWPRLLAWCGDGNARGSRLRYASRVSHTTQHIGY